jgi:4-diphosphocytidyl-2-C-methyl-D-erythritol kinase
VKRAASGGRRGAAPRARRRVVVDAHAKLNLGLAIGPRRADGFHDLVTVFQSISLADTLVAERRPSGFTLRVRHEHVALRGRTPRDAGAHVPTGASNLVLRAARLAARELALPGGAHFTLTKRIPSRAGLGGGSADAAAAFAAMLALHGRKLPLARRLEYASQLGSDVPFATFGGTALGQERGERLRRLRLRSPFRAVIAMPPWRVSTAAAFRAHDRGRNRLTRWEQDRRFARTIGRHRVETLVLVQRGNRFEALVGRRRRELESLCARLRAAGLLEPHLTGSGSAVFGIVPRGASVLEIVARFPGDEPLYAVRSVGRGLRLRTQATAPRPGKGPR